MSRQTPYVRGIAALPTSFQSVLRVEVRKVSSYYRLGLPDALLEAAGFQADHPLQEVASEQDLTLVAASNEGTAPRNQRHYTQALRDRGIAVGDRVVLLAYPGRVVVQAYDEARHDAVLALFCREELAIEKRAILEKKLLPAGPGLELDAQAFNTVSLTEVRYPDRQSTYRYSLFGQVLTHVCGIRVGDRLRSERFAEGVWLRPDPQGDLLCLPSHGDEQRPLVNLCHQRLLGGLVGETRAMVVYGKHGIAVVYERTPVSRFGLSRRQTVESLRESTVQVNTSWYDVPESGRLQISGEWLLDFGFAPGVSYDVVDSPIKKNTDLIVKSDEGRYAVTRLFPDRGLPKMYLPADRVQAFRDRGKAQVRVVAAADGLMVW